MLGAVLLAAAPLIVQEREARLRIEWSPPSPTTLARTIDVELEWKLAKLEVAGRAWPTRGLHGRERRRVACVDAFERIEDGRAVELVRTFTTLELARERSHDDLELAPRAREAACEAVSPLAGRAFRFRWQADARRHAVAALDADGDAEDWRALVEDCDLREFLPRHPVEVGASWDVEGRALSSLIEPCGVARFRDADEPALGWLPPNLIATLEPAVRVTLRRIVERDGARVAELAVAGRLVADDPASLASVDAAWSAVRCETSASRESLALEIEGTIAWSLDLRRARDARFELTFERELARTYETAHWTPDSLAARWTGRATIAARFE